MNQSLNVFKTFVVILTVVFILSGVSKVVHAEQNNKEKNEQQELLLPKNIYPLEFVNFDSSSNIIPLNQRLTKAHPSTTGLYPHEILVLGYAETFSSSQTEFQKFWLYKYSINNVHEVIISLIDRGYLEYGSIEQTLNNQTTKELKATLSLYSLKVSGKKEELIKRLLENISEDKLRELYPEKYYKLTNKGKAELNENEYVLRCHNGPSGDIDVWLMNQLLFLNPHMTYKEIIEKYLLIEGAEYYSHKDFGLYRNTHLKMYQFLEKENRLDEAFLHIAEVIFDDLSGCGNGFDLQYLNIYASTYFPYEKSLVVLPPAIHEWLEKVELEFKWNDEKLEEELCKHMREFVLPMHLFTPEECAKIAILEKNHKREELNEVYQIAEHRFRTNYPNVRIDN